jgi:hypothetical protein
VVYGGRGVMNILEMIKNGQYTKKREHVEWNRMCSYMMKGAFVYDFGNSVELHTYNHDHWFLYINGDIVSSRNWPESLNDQTISMAFEERTDKILEMIGGHKVEKTNNDF